METNEVKTEATFDKKAWLEQKQGGQRPREETGLFSLRPFPLNKKTFAASTIGKPKSSRVPRG